MLLLIYTDTCKNNFIPQLFEYYFIAHQACQGQGSHWNVSHCKHTCWHMHKMSDMHRKSYTQNQPVVFLLILNPLCSILERIQISSLLLTDIQYILTNFTKISHNIMNEWLEIFSTATCILWEVSSSWRK